MLVLVVDTSTPAVQAALVRVSDGAAETLAARCTVDARAHGELLAPAIDAVLTEASASVSDLEAVVAGLGPGPFTGLRVGLVTAAAIGDALAIPTYGVCSLDGLGATTTGTVLVATDARRKEIYWAVYTDGVAQTEPAVGHPGDVAVAAVGMGTTAAVGDGALRYTAELALPVPDEPRFPSLAVLAVRAAERITAKAPTEALHPLYLRRPDAVEPGPRKPVT